MDSIASPISFTPKQVFDENEHCVDVVAKEYLKKVTGRIHHLVPIKVSADGNCLYHSILLLMNNSMVTTNELRGIEIDFSFALLHSHFLKSFLVRTIIELVTNESYYQNMYLQILGPVDIFIQAACKNGAFSELYEIAALCSILGCNIRSMCPNIDFRAAMPILNNVFTPAPPIVASYEIALLWSHVRNEREARETNNGSWSPNHFVPLLSLTMHNESENTVQSKSLLTVRKISVNGNPKLPYFLFRLLKRGRSKTIPSLKCEFLNFSRRPADVYEATPTPQILPIYQLIQLRYKRRTRSAYQNNVKSDLPR